MGVKYKYFVKVNNLEEEFIYVTTIPLYNFDLFKIDDKTYRVDTLIRRIFKSKIHDDNRYNDTFIASVPYINFELFVDKV